MIKKVLVWPFRFFISGYQKFISPALPPRCRYFPSCSTYALESLEIHGLLKGTLLSIWRILRCNPISRGGVDYVPDKGKWPKQPLGYDELMVVRAKNSRRILDSTSTSENVEKQK